MAPGAAYFFDIVILSCFHREQKPLLLSRLMKSSPCLIHYFTQAPAPYLLVRDAVHRMAVGAYTELLLQSYNNEDVVHATNLQLVCVLKLIILFEQHFDMNLTRKSKTNILLKPCCQSSCSPDCSHSDAEL